MPKVYFDGFDLEDFGIKVCGEFSLSEAVPRVETISVPGRNGDLHFSDGTYENREASVRCYLYRDENVKDAFSALNQFSFGGGYKKLYCDDDPDHFLMARLVSFPPVQDRMNRISPFDLVFDCKPQRFLLAGEQPIDIPLGESVLFNSTPFDAFPIIYFDDISDQMGVSINGNGILFHQPSGYTNKLAYDAENISVYHFDFSSGKWIFHEYDSPSKAERMMLASGQNSIKTDNGNYEQQPKIKIIPRWWEL